MTDTLLKHYLKQSTERINLHIDLAAGRLSEKEYFERTHAFSPVKGVWHHPYKYEEAAYTRKECPYCEQLIEDFE